VGERNSGFLKLELLLLNCCRFFMLWTPTIIEPVV
jgi:hypothetical protein